MRNNSTNGGITVSNGVGNGLVRANIGGAGIPTHTPPSLLRQCGPQQVLI